MATLTIPSVVPSPSEDANRLRKAFVGWGTDEKTIISILGHRTVSQRTNIRRVYADTFGEELFQSLDKEISGDFERVVLLWTLDPAERDAFLANEAVRRWTRNNFVLIEIACARSSRHLFATREAYHARYKKSLEEDVAAHTTGDFRKLLVPLVSTFRYEGEEVNMTLAKSEAKILHAKISDKAYNDDEFIRIITTRSKAQLIATFNHYNDQFGHPINKDLKSDPKDELLAALRATIRCITCPAKYFEKVIRLAINRMGTDEGALTRVITTRAEIDLKDIKEIYQQRNSIPLDHAIAKDTSGVDIFDEESEPDNIDIDSVVKILEEEIALTDQVSDPDPYPKQLDLGFLLEASDDELGLPPADGELAAGDVTAGGDDIADCKIWGFDDEIRLDFGFDGGDDGDVTFDGGLFADLTWQTEFLPAL